MSLKSIAACLFALLLAACNPLDQLDTADATITEFHSVYNSGDVAALHAMYGQEYRDEYPIQYQQELQDFMTARLGTLQSTERSGFDINTNNGETISKVTMTSQFERGEATETFTFMGTGDEMRLVGWEIESDALMQVPQQALTPVDGAATAEEIVAD